MARSHTNHLSPNSLNQGKTSLHSRQHTSTMSSAGEPCVSPVPPEIHIQQVHAMDSYEGLPLHKRLRMSESWNS